MAGVSHSEDFLNEGDFDLNDNLQQTEYDNMSSSINIVDESESEIDQLLREWGLSDIKFKFKRAHIKKLYDLSLIQLADLDVLFPSFSELGLKMRFRELLQKWRIENGYTSLFCTIFSASTVSVNSSVSNWLESTGSISTISTEILSSTVNFRFNFSNFMNSKMGSCIKNKFSKNEVDNARKLLVRGIVDEFVLNDQPMTVSDFQSISKDIVQEFPNETAEYYYTKASSCSGKHYSTGLLYTRFKNQWRNKAKKPKLQEETSSTQCGITFCTNTDNSSDEVDFLSSKKWLSVIRDPWESVEIQWKKTQTGRRKEILESKFGFSSLYEDWPLLKDSKGYRLIDIDFGIMFPNKEMSMVEKWPSFLEKSTALFKNKIKNKKLLEEFDKAAEEKNENTINMQVIRLMCVILKPDVKPKDKNGATWSPTVLDAMDSICMEVDSSIQITETISKKQNKYSEYNLKMQPIIFLLKDNNSKCNYNVIYDDIIYSFENFLTALDISFKIFVILNLEYPVECKKVFYFIQKYFYDIKTDFDEPSYFSDGQIANLIKDYNNMK